MTVRNALSLCIALVAMGFPCVAYCADTGDSPAFNAEHGEVSDRFVIAHPIDQVFPLFDPVNEIKWSPDFVITSLYPRPFAVIQGAVFQTVHDQQHTTTWLVDTYDKADGRIDYVLFNPDNRITKITIRCRALGADKTEVTVSYAVTGLSVTGNMHVAHYDRAFLDEWRVAIEGYFAGLSGHGGHPH